MDKKKVYISGKITGLPLQVAMDMFNEMEKNINNSGQYEAVNPCRLLNEEYGSDQTWGFYMGESVKLLLDCQHITFLNNSRSSRGAIIERKIAKLENITELIGFKHFKTKGGNCES